MYFQLSSVIRSEDFQTIMPRILQRSLLSSDVEENRLQNDAARTMKFFTLFSLFTIMFGGFSYYVYQRPYDGPGGTSCVSRTRRIPLLRDFFRQPKQMLNNKTIVHENNVQEEETISLKNSNNIVTIDTNNISNDINNNHNTTMNDIDKKHIMSNNSENVNKNVINKDILIDKIKNDEIVDENMNDKLGSLHSSQYLFGSPTITLMLCSLGLLITYITWGFMQERIMSHPYGDRDDESNWFKHSEFCVLINRIFGMIIAFVALSFTGNSGNDAPPFIVSMCALSNMCSSWFQYESLHYVTFPVQTIFKSSKVLITMAVGVLIGKTYSLRQYVNALFIAGGVYIFLSEQRKNKTDDKELGMYFYLGLVLVMMYAFTDAFTSNWQAKIFELTKISSVEMMLSINAFTFVISFVFCFGSLYDIYIFYLNHPLIIWHSMIMGLCGGFGQLLIFYTISHFGAVRFAAVMTFRMVLNVLLSIIYYGHEITVLGVVGIAITFIALFYQTFDKTVKAKKVAK